MVKLECRLKMRNGIFIYQGQHVDVEGAGLNIPTNTKMELGIFIYVGHVDVMELD